MDKNVMEDVEALATQAREHLSAGRTKVAAAILDELAREAREAAKALRKEARGG